MTTQHTPSFDAELARQTKATESAQALVNDLERVIEQQRASLSTLRAAARAVCASRVRCTDDVAMVDRVALGELEGMIQ
jgi:hypothetical protein